MKYRELRERDEAVLDQIQSFNPHALSMIEKGMTLYRGRGSHFSTGIYQARKQKISYTGYMYNGFRLRMNLGKTSLLEWNHISPLRQ